MTWKSFIGEILRTVISMFTIKDPVLSSIVAAQRMAGKLPASTIMIISKVGDVQSGGFGRLLALEERVTATSLR